MFISKAKNNFTNNKKNLNILFMNIYNPSFNNMYMKKKLF